MTDIRNLSTSDIELDDLGGITISASSDYNLSEESGNDIANSQDLNNAIIAGDIIFLDSIGNPLTQQESLDIRNSISATLPSFTIRDNGINVTDTPFSNINFVENVSAVDTDPTADIDFVSNLGLFPTMFGAQEIMTFNDPNRSNKILSIEKIPFLLIQSTISSGTYLKILNTVTNSNNGYVMPFDATIVGFSSFVNDANSRTGSYRIYVNNVDVSGIVITYSGSGEKRSYDNTLNIDINIGDKLQFRCTSISGGGMNRRQYDMNVVLYIRWRG